jgi:competence protein ComEC
MSRVLPAQVVLGSLVLGLCAANAFRPHGVSLAVLVLPPVVPLAAPRLSPVVLAAALVGAFGWWWGAMRLDALDRTQLAADIGRAGDLTVVTTADARPGTFVARQMATAVSFEGRRLDERVELELPLERPPPQGARLAVLAQIAAPRGPSHGFDERTWLRRQGIHVVLKVDRVRVLGHRGGLGGVADRLRSWLRRASTPGLSGNRRALVEGVVLGDDTGLSYGLKQAFRRSGLYHLLAVSGENVVLLAAGMLWLGVLAGLPRAWSHVAALAAIGGYVLAVGPQPSVIRAAVSGGAVSVAWLLGRERDGWHALLLAAVVLLGWSPYALFDAGFQLSFAAVAAIFVLGRPLVLVLEGYPLPARVRGPIAIAVACSLATAPILCLQFGAVPLLGVLANVLVEAAVGPLLAVAFATALLDAVSPGLAELLAALNGLVAAYVAWCAELVSSLPVAQASGPWSAAAAGASLVAAVLLVRSLRRSG